MFKLMVTLHADDPDKWVLAHEMRKEKMGHKVAGLTSYVDPAGTGKVGMSLEVHDYSILESLLNDDDVIELMKENGGVNEPCFFVEVKS